MNSYHSLSGYLEYFPLVGTLGCQSPYLILSHNRIGKRSKLIQCSSESPQSNDRSTNGHKDQHRPIKIFFCIFPLENHGNHYMSLFRITREEDRILGCLDAIFLGCEKSLPEAEVYEVDIKRETEVT